MYTTRPGSDPAERFRRGVLVLLLAVGLFLPAACSPPPPTEPVDLLLLTPPDLAAEHTPLPRAPRHRLDFAGGLPAGVTAGPEGVRLTPVTGGIQLEADEPPWIEFRLTVDSLRHQALRATLGPPGDKPAELYFSFTDPPEFNLVNRVARSANPENGGSICLFPLPNPDAVRVPIEVLRLYPGGRGSSRVEIRRLELIPRGPDYLGREILSRDWVELAQDYRRCWRFSGPGERSATFRVPLEDAVLHFSTGTMIGGRGARLRVELSGPGGGEAELWRGPFGPAGRSWSEQRVDLSPWAGDEVTLRFVAETKKKGVFLVGRPVARRAAEPQAPSVLVVLIDTVRADSTSAYGHQRRSTPHLDRLARQGLLFSRVTAPSSWTLPSTAALLTGHYPDELGIREGGGPAVPGEIPTLAERLSGAGFTCGGFVANFGLSPFRSFARGFDAYFVAPFSEKMMRADQLNRLTLDWVAEHRDERLFCYVHYMDPHAPYDAPAPDRPGERRAGPFDIGHGHQWRDGDIVPLVMGWQQVSGAQDLATLRGYYDDEISFVDRQLGALLAGLEALGVLENMVVVVTSDHGEEFLDHGNWSHGWTLYDEVLRVPMLLLAPDLPHPAGTVIHRPVTLIDVVPTLASLCALPAAAGRVSGRDLLSGPEERTLFSQTTAGQAPLRFSVIENRYKYAYFDRAAAEGNPPKSAIGRRILGQGPPGEALYDISLDPLERENLIEARPEVARRLREEMRRRMAEVTGEDGPAGAESEVDRQTAERLRALGYME